MASAHVESARYPNHAGQQMQRPPRPGYVVMTPARYGYNPRFPHHHQQHHHQQTSQSNSNVPPDITIVRPYYRTSSNVTRALDSLGSQAVMFDTRRVKKTLFRRTVDYFTPIVRTLQNRTWQRDYRDRLAIQPDALYYPEISIPKAYEDEPQNCVLTKFIRVSTNKVRCPIFTCTWTPDGRRLVTGASSGEFTLWNGLTFNFETILQAHDAAIRAMIWSHNDNWMLTGDQNGYLKYWQINMNNVKMYQAHRESVRGLSFCSTDAKFASCADDGTVRIWDFVRCYEEKVLRGHGADVKCVAWHPYNSLVVSGSKDSQQPMKLWDARSGQSLATIHAHKNTVCDIAWNNNGNWLLTASRDHLIKLFDVRNFKEEIQTFKGHKREAQCVSWHPLYEGLFVSGGADGSLMYWSVGHEQEIGGIESAHDQIVWHLSWHPVGHILASSANDHTTKFWTRNKPGDKMADKYNLNLLPIEHEQDITDMDDNIQLPGMGFTQQVYDHIAQRQVERVATKTPRQQFGNVIPGLDIVQPEEEDDDIIEEPPAKIPREVITESKPVPVNRSFERAWKSGSKRTLPGQPPPPPVFRPPTILNNPRAPFAPRGVAPRAPTPAQPTPPANWRPNIPPQPKSQMAYWSGIQPAAVELPGGGKTSDIDIMDDFQQKRMDEAKEWDPLWEPGRTETYVDHYQHRIDDGTDPQHFGSRPPAQA